jgi:hypothetical protein
MTMDVKLEDLMGSEVIHSARFVGREGSMGAISLEIFASCNSHGKEIITYVGMRRDATSDSKIIRFVRYGTGT